jgi:hypothetical protein
MSLAKSPLLRLRPGSFAVEILDSVHRLDRGALMLRAKVS